MTPRALLAVAAAMVVACGSSSSAGSGASAEDTAFYGGTIQVNPADGATLPMSKIQEIKQVSGVKTAFPVYRFDARTGQVEAAGVIATDSIIASDPTEAAWSSLKTDYAQGHAIDADSSGEVVLGSAIADELKKSVGDGIDLPLKPQGGVAGHPFKVVGVLGETHTAPDRFAYVNITDGQMLLKDALPAAQGDQVDVTAAATAIDVYAKGGTSIGELDSLADQINEQVTGVNAIKPSRLVDSLKK
ncbi:MAG TPA: ABC transporter permease [Candidatus Dormibacteraeota bacterium]|nr:ABC transporter permease [Candidatus Dormibacteraeota bacterium]